MPMEKACKSPNSPTFANTVEQRGSDKVSYRDGHLPIHTRKVSAEDQDGDYPQTQYSTVSTSSSTIPPPATFRKKARAGTLYIAATLAYESLSVKVASRTQWANVLGLIWLSTLTTAIFTALVTYLAGRQNKCDTRWSRLLSRAGASSSTFPRSHQRSYLWEATPLGVSTVVSSSLYALQAAYLAPDTTHSIYSHLAPALLLLTPAFPLSAQLPKSSLLLALSLLIPACYGLALLSIVSPINGTLLAIASTLAEAVRLLSAKQLHCTRSSSTSPFQIMHSYALPMLMAATLIILPVALRHGAGLYKPRRWLLYPLTYGPLVMLQQLAAIHAAQIFDSPISLALLHIPKGIILAVLHINFNPISAFRQTPTQIQYYAISLVSLIALFWCTPDLRERWLPTRLRPASPRSLTGDFQAMNFQPWTIKQLAVLASAPLLYWIFYLRLGSLISISPLIRPLQTITPSLSTVDIVISYYDEDLNVTREFLQNMYWYPWIRESDPRFILYLKNKDLDAAEIQKATGVHEVIRLDNRGREAGTYLKHILRNYNASIDPKLNTGYRTGLADHTVFFQEHLAWQWIALERMWLFRKNTGYLHFAPYIKMDCGKDLEGNGEFESYVQLYGIFREEFCPPTLQLGAYAAQFVVSKKRILQNPYKKYEMLDSILEADADHWIHKQGWWWKYHGEPGPSNPYLGHMLERSWPMIFDCDRQSIADTCSGDKKNVTGCQCLD